MSNHGKRIAVVGGSIGGLTAALLLRDLGFDVDVYERTPDELDGRGGGIVLQPETFRWFKERSNFRPDQLSTVSSFLRCLGPDNEVAYEEPNEWRFTSWGTLYRALLADFGRDHYHLGQSFVGIDNRADGVTLRFCSGRTEEADLVIFADGITSVGRKRLLPQVEATYAGYIGWRGTVPERELSPATMRLLGDALGYAFGEQTHICMYPIPGPGDGIAGGERLMNYVWYRNLDGGSVLDEIMTDKAGFRAEVSVHPGRVQDRFVDEMKTAARALPPAAAELVQATAHPYIQPIFDIRVPQMTFGRAVLLGDSAFVARPHAAAGSAKAAAEAWALADALADAQGDIDAALDAWEPGQLSIGNALIDRVEHMGRCAQVTSTWSPHDLSLRFGLREGAMQPIY